MLCFNLSGKKSGAVPVSVTLKSGKQWTFTVPPWPRLSGMMEHRDFGELQIGDKRMKLRVCWPKVTLKNGKEFWDVCSGSIVSRERQLVGIDFGSDSIKVVELEDDGQKLRLKKCGCEPIYPDCIVDGAIMNHTKVRDALHRLLEREGLLGCRAAVAVSGHSTIVKKIGLPQMSQAELAAGSKWEAEQYIPFDIKEVYIDAQIIEPNAGQGQMDILLCAVKKDVVDDYVSVARKADADPVIVDVNLFAVHNLFERLYSFPRSGAVALIDFGACMSSIEIVVDGIHGFSRDISLGGMLLTEEIQRQLNVDFATAVDYQTPPDKIGSAALRKKVDGYAHRVAAVLATEIQRSWEFFQATSLGQTIEKAYITGGASQMTGLVKELEKRLAVPIEQFDCFRGMDVAPSRFDMDALEADKTKFAVAMGLALRRG